MRAFADIAAVWLVIACMISTPILSFKVWSDAQYISMLKKIESYEKGEHAYFFNGANARGLLDICEADWKVAFKDDCPRGAKKMGGGNG